MLDFSKLQEALDAMGSGNSSDSSQETAAPAGQAVSETVAGSRPDSSETVAAGRPAGGVSQTVAAGAAPSGGGTVVGSARAVEETHAVAASGAVYAEDDISVEEVEWFADEPAREPAAPAAGTGQSGWTISDEDLNNLIKDVFGKGGGAFGKNSAGAAAASGSAEGPSDAGSLLKELERACDMFATQGTRSYAGLGNLLARAAKVAEGGDPQLCDRLGLLYMLIDDDSAIGKTRRERSQEAVRWFGKAARDAQYPRRVACGRNVARLSLLPKYENINLKQAREWFTWSAGMLADGAPEQAAEDWLCLGRIAEYEGKYDEAARCRNRHDELSGTRRGAAEQAMMQVIRGIDAVDGMVSLREMAEDDEPYAAVALAYIVSNVEMSEELNDEFPGGFEEILERYESVPDASAALAIIRYAMCLDEDEELVIEKPEDEEFHKQLTDAYSRNSIYAAYFLGQFYVEQLGNLLDNEKYVDMVKDTADNALFFLRQAAGQGFLPALKEFARVNIICYGFDADTQKVCDMLDLLGEKEYADGIRAQKDEWVEDALFV